MKQLATAFWLVLVFAATLYVGKASAIENYDRIIRIVCESENSAACPNGTVINVYVRKNGTHLMIRANGHAIWHTNITSKEIDVSNAIRFYKK